MKTAKTSIQWFDAEDHRQNMRASIGTDQKMRMGRELQRNLPLDIRLGLDIQNRVLVIADGHGSGIHWPKNGIVSAKAISKQLRSIGLKLPLVFEFEKDSATGFYLGNIVPQRQANENEAYDVEQMLVIYPPMIDSIVDRQAKSTPKSERKAAAVAAFCEAVQDYAPDKGDLREYLEAHLYQRLIIENRKYTESYRDIRMDIPFHADGENRVTLRDRLADQSSGGIHQMEAKIMAEQFMDSLTEQERHLVRLMRQELKLPQIALEMQLMQDEVIQLGREIGHKRESFYHVA